MFLTILLFCSCFIGSLWGMKEMGAKWDFEDYQRGLESIKLPAGVKTEYSGGWQFFTLEDCDELNLVKEKGSVDSKFFKNQSLYDYAYYYGKEKGELSSFYKLIHKAFPSGHYLLWAVFGRNFKNRDIKMLSKFFLPEKLKSIETEDDKSVYAENDLLKQEIVDGCAYRYKIHLQVQKEFICDVVKVLLRLIENKELKHVCKFKVTFFPDRERHKNGDQAIPMIALYPVLLPGDKEFKNKYLRSIIKTLITKLAKYKDKALNPNKVKPRWNKRITNLIWIAGGDGDDKKVAYEWLKDVRSDKFRNKLLEKMNKVYTEDMAFFKGYEYEHAPVEEKEEPLPRTPEELGETLKRLMKESLGASREERKRIEERIDKIIDSLTR